MKINPLWNICLFIRILITVVIRIYYTNNIFKILAFLGLLVIGLGFTFKSLTGSNNEKQFSKVFWHETRGLHGFFYILAAYYLYNNNIDMNTIVLLLDICLSLLFRFVTNQ
tara:strand:- start:124 stop:456 length:333 start_codon:yes stop_codon:yes gene_type:complete